MLVVEGQKLALHGSKSGKGGLASFGDFCAGAFFF